MVDVGVEDVLSPALPSIQYKYPVFGSLEASMVKRERCFVFIWSKCISIGVRNSTPINVTYSTIMLVYSVMIMVQASATMKMDSE